MPAVPGARISFSFVGSDGLGLLYLPAGQNGAHQEPIPRSTEFLPSDEWLQKSNRTGSFSVAGQWAQGLRITIAQENPPFGPSGRPWPPGNQSHCSDCRGPIWFKTFYQFTESQLNFKTPFDITTAENTILCLV